jgi:hypothetical protein
MVYALVHLWLETRRVGKEEMRREIAESATGRED